MLEAGTRIGAYEIREAIGAGGMGEVYRARDTRLQRDVALKILPEAFASDPERLARFEREAQMLAALNHPHIAAIHGVEESSGMRALILELVDGETLADRIATGAIPVDEAIAIARQIADALEAAHEQGIVHRDLKPSNVKVRPDGTVKVLDFGLAKLATGVTNAGSKDPAYTSTPFTVAPTITTPAMTQLGVIMGTAAYMSPEQAKGREADKRSDVWAFGAVLYEMLTGRRAFDGDDMSDTLASVLKIDPDWTRLPSDLPPALRTLIQRCLAKDRRQRVADIAAAKFVLNELADAHPLAPPALVPSTSPRSRRWLPLAATAVLTAAIVGGVMWALRPAIPAGIPTQFTIALPEGQSFSGTVLQSVAISPDGSQIAYTGNSRVYLRSIGELMPHAIPGSESDNSSNPALGVASPMFSPDGKSVAFLALSGITENNILKQIPISGGAASAIATLNAGESSSIASWGPGGILLGGRGGIRRVSPAGGTPERIIEVGPDEEAQAPQMLPDGQTVLFTLGKRSGTDRWDKAQIVTQSLNDHTRRVLIDGGSDARYLASGHLLFAVAGTVFARPFDPRRLTFTGSQVPVVVGVRRSAGGSSLTTHLAVSANGTLIYRPGPATSSSAARVLVLGDGRQDPVALKVPPALYAHPRVSRDGNMLAVARIDGSQSDLWLYDLSGRTEIRRLTFGGTSTFPAWSSDSRFVTFQSTREGDKGLWSQSADGRAAERLTKANQGEAHQPESWSPDGKHLLYSILKDSSYALWVYSADTRKSEPFGKVQSQETLSATFSPDGRWVAYAFTERAGGGASPNRGVYVEPFPSTGEKHQAPKTALDYHPVWAGDGNSIFYLPGANRPVMSVPIVTHPSVSFGAPVLSPRPPTPALLSLEVRGYDVLPDGRFVSVALGSGDSVGNTGNELRVLLNWFEELKRLAPVK
jgi:serine/threonine-protein kinase